MKKLRWGWKVDFTAARKKWVAMGLLVNACQPAWLEAKPLESGRGQKVVSVKGEMVEAHDLPAVKDFFQQSW